MRRFVQKGNIKNNNGMKFYSTNNPPSPEASAGKKINLVDFKTALLAGLAPDNGLFMPEKFPKLSGKFFEEIGNKKFWEIAVDAGKKFIGDIPRHDLEEIVKEAFDFEIPVKDLGKNLYVLELFHGPTLAFKDFGARFMARVMNYYLKQGKKNLNIIVATSGDTGRAVAQGFYGLSNVKVFVLYPSKRITELQEKQMATLGKNIVAIEVGGSFDDCQKLAKQILSDGELKKKFNFTSANSINFGRLLPQSFYYLWGYAQMKKIGIKEFVYCVPSGNFGNLTAGLMAKRMGMNVSRFIAATNANDVFPRYLETGKFVSRVSRETISNAMDVGNPSNFARLLDMYGNNVKQAEGPEYSRRAEGPEYSRRAEGPEYSRGMADDVVGISITDNETRETIKNVYRETNYICDPHTAVGVTAGRKSNVSQPIVVLGTAHPAKFREIVEPLIGKKVVLPPQLTAVLEKQKKSLVLENNFEKLRKAIVNSAI